ncbi:hypothetical protein OV208_17840 [Corallococcus sp. bb12-1]|uniref:hypothetical protein n=1 Tax=Corallococcus sp. bb12-1 TaxID=2996784 RepID=UPI00226F2C9B|nr:hypothetical protein [Corallococcus sp. bb12-1]MCY1043184.1 hypothetical protein [Corallococcus sp. bb12-1]
MAQFLGATQGPVEFVPGAFASVTAHQNVFGRPSLDDKPLFRRLGIAQPCLLAFQKYALEFREGRL